MISNTDNTLTRQDMIKQECKMLQDKELTAMYTGTTITGKYFYNNTWFKFIVNSFSDGSIKGHNNVGSFDEGRWKINDDNSLYIEWDGYWENWTGFGYQVGNEIMFFDSTTNHWRSTYTLVEDGELPTRENK